MRLPWLANDEAPGPYITIPQYQFNKTKQHTQTHGLFCRFIFLMVFSADGCSISDFATVKRRESSKRNYYIISPRVIIKAFIIIISQPAHRENRQTSQKNIKKIDLSLSRLLDSFLRLNLNLFEQEVLF